MTAVVPYFFVSSIILHSSVCIPSSRTFCIIGDSKVFPMT
ncbi:hypothetical protein RUMHYD_02152 [Blautia hydrogenotrophica DSM 10507]|uniref:Uncharacterized protein n=1 Tax=Blautia hydrogenotrophica (strain DSM 10507 / JCM 14656 / S5a33) TaxID=476272 RepID=C0CMR4_BLAHS|nr:hypothetical protein RUMHYD_02152 [Blautia hydrogenotrophica DSM 10507]